MKDNTISISIIGLGYVGFPLFQLLESKFKCNGIDINKNRIEYIVKEYPQYKSLITSDWDKIVKSDIYIIAVPTPITKDKDPDLKPLQAACSQISYFLKPGDLIIFESTVSPGITEEFCIPIIEMLSGLVLNRDFSVGYSPERINVGDQIHQLANTSKIISASNPHALDTMSFIYGEIIEGKIIKAPSIKVAEAAKMYENVQRDLLIALANQFADYCHAEKIDIQAVTDCASSKWNFSDVRPGLVGGHCISVDPYYLIKRAEELGVDLPLVKVARFVNEERSKIIASRILNRASTSLKPVGEQSILFLGFSYKKNTSDIRNTKVAEIIHDLEDSFSIIDCYDPFVEPLLCKASYNVNVYNNIDKLQNNYDLVIKTVPHTVFDNFSYPSTQFINLNDLL